MSKHNNHKQCTKHPNYIRCLKENSIRNTNRRLNRINIYNQNPNLCLNCNSLIVYDKRHNKFCNNSCATIYNNIKRGSRKLKTKKKISISNSLFRKNLYKLNPITCEICNKQNPYERRFRKTCSIACKRKLLSKLKRDFYIKFPEKHPNRLCAGIRESYPEQMLREFLEQSGLVNKHHFIQQFKVNKYFVDFYFPKLNLGIEVDGEYWHDKFSSKEIIRENEIKKLINLIRFNAKDIISKKCEIELINLINKCR